MSILGVDYGTKKIGLAIAFTSLAEPFSVITYSDETEAIKKIKRIVEKERIEKIVVGVSEKEMAKKSKVFANKLREKSDIEVELSDETLSTKLAEKLSIEAGIKRKKRRELEDAYAAALMLQNYLDID